MLLKLKQTIIILLAMVALMGTLSLGFSLNGKKVKRPNPAYGFFETVSSPGDYFLLCIYGETQINDEKKN